LEAVDELAIAGVLFTSHYLDTLDQTIASPAHLASILRAHQAGLKLLLGRDDSSNDDGLSEVLAALQTPLGWPAVGPRGDAVVVEDEPWQ
jgi:hypothetical protein